MLQTGSQMSPLWAPGLVCLIYGFTTVCGAAVGAKNDCYRKTCGPVAYDIREAVCCENHLYPGRGLSCCGKRAFNPDEATCCKEEHGYTITVGLSEKVSACCGMNAYNSLNEICCESTVVVKPAPKAQCCGKAAFDEDKQLCCGQNRTILTRKSSHHQCCGHDQFDIKTQRCCFMNNSLEIQPINIKCCEEDSDASEVGLSEKVSACCGMNAYNSLNEICCESTVVVKSVPKAQCCGKAAFDEDKQLCCGQNRTILTRKSSHHQCCGHDQFDIKTQRCCFMNNNLEIQPINTKSCEEDSDASEAFCGTKAFNKSTELCCQSTVVAKLAPNDQCCGKEAFDEDKQLCCGKNQVILTRKSSHHQCCGHDQFDTNTQCCCWTNKDLEIQPINSSCCVKESGVQQQKRGSQPHCTGPNTSLCGLSCYNPHEFGCCERNQTKSHWCGASGRCVTGPTVYNLHTHLCCEGRVSERKPWIDQCCGETPYGLAQRGVLCCNNTLYTDREDGEECSDINIPYNPTKGTMCCSQFHGSPGQHCCGTEVYQPHTEICCNGHRHPKGENMHCCGVQAYDIKNRQMKCCAGTLYNMTLLGMLGHEAQCCGSILHNQSGVCCSSEGKEVLYSNKTGFRCCGHLYYNTSLWSCCAGKLSPAHKPGHDQNNESKLLSVNNLNEKDLCEKMQIGTVESVSLHSIVFHSVLTIHGRHATVKPLPSPHILKTRNCCNSPKLIPGKTYFFDEVNIFADFNHDSILQSICFIISKCSSEC